MNVVFHKRFEKTAKRLPPKVKQKMIERIELFANDPLNSQLRNHSLHTPYKGSYSIDITGDYRAVYVLVNEETAMFTHIGTSRRIR